MTNAPDSAVEGGDVDANPDEMTEGPAGGDEAPSLPAQDLNNASGQQYNLPDKVEKVPTAVNFKLKSDMKVCVAFDYMRVKVGEIVEMQHFTPVLLKLLAEEEKKKEQEAVAATEKVDEDKRKKGKQGKQNKKQK
jgi:ribonuclease Z